MGLSINPIVSFKQTKAEKISKNQPLGGKIIAPNPPKTPEKQTPQPLAGNIQVPPMPVKLPTHPPYTTAGIIAYPQPKNPVPEIKKPPLAGQILPPDKTKEFEKPQQEEQKSDV